MDRISARGMIFVQRNVLHPRGRVVHQELFNTTFESSAVASGKSPMPFPQIRTVRRGLLKATLSFSMVACCKPLPILTSSISTSCTFWVASAMSIVCELAEVSLWFWSGFRWRLLRWSRQGWLRHHIGVHRRRRWHHRGHSLNIRRRMCTQMRLRRWWCEASTDRWTWWMRRGFACNFAR